MFVSIEDLIGIEHHFADSSSDVVSFTAFSPSEFSGFAEDSDDSLDVIRVIRDDEFEHIDRGPLVDLVESLAEDV
ncbi:MAG: hypothetical protein RL226_2311 [Bacteroidota bacterium]